MLTAVTFYVNDLTYKVLFVLIFDIYIHLFPWEILIVHYFIILLYFTTVGYYYCK